MNESYLNSVRNTILSSKPSTTIRLLLMVLFFAFSGIVNAQCSISSTTNASTLSCGTSPLSSCGGILYIGNGSTSMSLMMNSNLDLTCLGAIQFIVRNNATLDFSGGNYDLKLAAGSSVVFQTGSAIYSGSGCSASDIIKIGGSSVANCNGSGSTPSFVAVVANGGINQAGILSGNQYICTYGTTTTTFSSTVSGGTWSSGNTSIATVNSSTGVVTAVAAGTAIITYTRSGVTATRAVYVANGPSSNAVLTGSNSQCQSTTTSYSASPVSGASSYTWSYSGSGVTITPVANGLSASISFSSTATSGNLKVTTTNACGSAGGGNELYITVSPIITGIPVVGSASNIQCDYAQLNWNTVSNATGYYLDIATNSGFTSFVTGYNNFYVSGNNSSYGASNLPAGTLYYRVRGYNNCTTTANSSTASFQTTAPLGGSVSSSQTICSGTSPSNLTLSGYTTTNTAILKWQKSSDAVFSSPTDIAVTTANLSGATIGNLTANTYFRAIVQNQFGSWCTSNSNSVLITVTPATATPSVTLTQPTCSVSTGIITVNTPVPGAGITYTVTGPSPSAATVTNSTGVFSGLMAGTYDVTANDTSACSVSVATNVTINISVTNTWNGASWSNGTPNSAQKLVFSGNYPPAVDPNVDITGCSCMVTGGATVTIKTGKTLTITNEVTVVGGGTLTFENNASLVQINNTAVNSGNITYKRTTSSVRTSDYTYWSSPVASQNLNISPSYGSGMFYSYNDFADPEDWKGETASTVMAIGKGYIIRGPHITGPPPPPGLYDATFTGEPNNGTKTIAIGPTGTSNLLGNPYPSAIDADKFLATNSTRVEGTIYFWTHNTAIQLASNIASGKVGTGVLAYTSDDYASYNTTGGVRTGNFEGSVEEIANKPTGKIAAGQAFFTTSLGAGTVTFNNEMRLSSGGAILNNSQFFKTRNPKVKTNNIIEKHRIWLNLTNSEGAFKQTLIGYVTGATNDYDSRFDGESFDANEFVDFYSINEDKNLVIQGRALPFDENEQVPLGYRSTIDGVFSISIDQVDGLLTNQSVLLEDKLTNTVFDLKNGNYVFNTVAGTFKDRFVLSYSSKTLSVDSRDKEEGILVIYSNNFKTLIIRNNGDSTINSVSLFNTTGQNIAVWDIKDLEQTNIELPIKNISSGVYIVKIKTTTGESTKKIIVNH